MEIEKRVEGLEGEFKLIKGEVKQSLSDIRDYVLGGELAAEVLPMEEERRQEIPPVSQIVVPLGPGAQPPQGPAEYEQIEETWDEMPPQAREEPRFEAPQWEERAVREVPRVDEADTMPIEPDDLSKEDVEEEEAEETSDDGLREAAKEEKMIGDARGSMLQANQLPNLIRWVSTAKREIGSAQLPTFLEAYSVRGHLPPAMKEIILHLAAVVAEGSGEPSSADVWSRLTLELHGILSDGSR
jgi:hypothetical protein